MIDYSKAALPNHVMLNYWTAAKDVSTAQSQHVSQLVAACHGYCPQPHANLGQLQQALCGVHPPDLE
jgi:hypothetical protein